MTKKKLMRIMFFVIFSSLCFTFLIFTAVSSQAEETINITTYYPAPYVVFNDLELTPLSTIPSCSVAADEGTMYYDDNINGLMLCQQDPNSPSNFIWVTSLSVWTLAGTSPNQYLYPNDNTWKVGIGAVPVNKLDVEGSAAIGASYSGTNTAPSNGLLVEGSTGIGTATPVNKLDVEGSVAIGSSYSGTNTAPSNGLLVEGNVGIGTTSPGTNKLDVTGNIHSTGDVCTDQAGGKCLSHGFPFGGSYALTSGTCSTANMITGNCSCPSGFTAYLIAECFGGRCGYICMK